MDVVGRSISQHIRDDVHRFQFRFTMDFAFDLDRLEYIDPDLDLGKYKIVNIEASDIGYQ